MDEDYPMIGWRLEIPKHGITFEAERLRRERQELIGELIVKCELPGARTVNGCLVTGDFNFSSVRARTDRAKLLAERAKTNGEVDWYAHLEEFCQGVFEREREGDPAQDIWDIAPPEKNADFAIEGLAFPRKHPSILFGDGGAAKSYIALYIAGRLALQGVSVALFDWELSGDVHRSRFERLFPGQKPALTYCRCENGIRSEIERIARIVRDRKILYAFFDSIAFASEIKPEDAEAATRYMQAVRTLGIGSLHIAHINKSEDAEFKPFGSVFWHNGARCTWFVKAEDGGGGVLNLGFFNRKSNLDALRNPVALRLTFGNSTTRLERANIIETPELAEKMKIWQRMEALLDKQGALTAIQIADELDVKVDSIRKATNRTGRFVVIPGGAGEQDRIALRSAI